MKRIKVKITVKYEQGYGLERLIEQPKGHFIWIPF